EHERATRLFAAVERGLEERGMPFDVYEPVGRPLRDRAVAACRDAIGEETFRALWREGRELGLEEAEALAFGQG
ncbi:MAG: hypothetical protein R3199_05215, partial [Gemmatimonadota bacterium]|nr:hypothetical protein [Gemmatimonadota bacterium]